MPQLKFRILICPLLLLFLINEGAKLPLQATEVVSCLPYRISWQHGRFGDAFFSVDGEQFVYRYWSWIPVLTTDVEKDKDGNIVVTTNKIDAKMLMCAAGYDGISYWLVVYDEIDSQSDTTNANGQPWVLSGSQPRIFVAESIEGFADRSVRAAWPNLDRGNPFLTVAFLESLEETAGAKTATKEFWDRVLDVEGAERLVESDTIRKCRFESAQNPFFSGPWQCEIEMDNSNVNPLKTIQFSLAQSWAGNWPYELPTRFEIKRSGTVEKLSKDQFSYRFYLNSSRQDLVPKKLGDP